MTRRSVSIADGRLLVRFPFDPKLTVAVADIEGSLWDRADAAWRLPVSAARALAAVLADQDFTWIGPAAVFARGAGVVPRPVQSGRLYRYGSDYIVAFPYDGAKHGAMRRVPGATWDKATGGWRVPGGPFTARRLADFVHLWQLKVDAETTTVLTEEATQGALMVKLSGSTRLTQVAGVERLALPEGVELVGDEIKIPGLRMEPRWWQPPAIVYEIVNRRCFNADQMGIGKTFESIAAIHALGAYPAVVACPVKVRTNWAREFARAVPTDKRIAVVLPASDANDKAQLRRLRRQGFTPMAGRVHPGYDVYITNRDQLVPRADDLVAVGPKALILDESQDYKNRAKRRVCPTCGKDLRRGQKTHCDDEHRFSKAGHRYKVTWIAAAKSIADRMPADAPIFCLSGTPNKNNTEDLISQLDILGRLDEFGGEAAFLDAYCKVKTVDPDDPNDAGTSVAHELHEQLQMRCMTRRLTLDVHTELDPPYHDYLEVDGAGPAWETYKEAEADTVGYLGRVAAEKTRRLLGETAGDDAEVRLAAARAKAQAELRAEAAEHLVRVSTLRQLAARAKMDAAGEWVREFMDEDPTRKLLVFAHHTEIVSYAAGVLGGAPTIVGGVAQHVVDETVDAFQSQDDPRAIVIGIMAGGIGLTLTRARHQLFLEAAWTPGDIDQAVSRSFGRADDPHGVNVTHLILAGSIDEDMRDLLARKRELFDEVIDGKSAKARKGEDESVLADLIVGLAERGGGFKAA